MKKQETLEEAAERLYSDKEYSMYGEIRRHSFIAGAKSDTARDYWFKIFQQDKNKFEEAFYKGWLLRGSVASFRDALKQSFEQFKKK
jgi:hypothetical protein